MIKVVFLLSKILQPKYNGIIANFSINFSKLLWNFVSCRKYHPGTKSFFLLNNTNVPFDIIIHNGNHTVVTLIHFWNSHIYAISK